MKIRKVKKLYQNWLVDLRSDEVKRYIKEGGVVVQYEKRTMALGPEELKRPKKITANIPSKFKGVYDLHSFAWKPKDERQKEFI